MWDRSVLGWAGSDWRGTSPCWEQGSPTGAARVRAGVTGLLLGQGCPNWGLRAPNWFQHPAASAPAHAHSGRGAPAIAQARDDVTPSPAPPNRNYASLLRVRDSDHAHYMQMKGVATAPNPRQLAHALWVTRRGVAR